MIYRVDVFAKPELNAIDPAGEGVRRQLVEAGYHAGAIRTRRLYLIDSDAPEGKVREAATSLLADPIAETVEFYDVRPARPTTGSVVEVHLKPGVMDPVAATAERALRDLGIRTHAVRTGRAFAFENAFTDAALASIAKRYLANSVVETVFYEPQLPASFAEARVAGFQLRHVAIRDLNDDALVKLSRDGHLFLNLVEMQAIQTHYRSIDREPTDVELETLAQTWSEHCVHKTLKSAVEVVDETGTVVRRYGNLIKETIFASTMELMKTKGDFCLSVFKDNAGVIAFDDEDAVCFKVETHNRPSAIEPYGGAATGIGGCIRDVLGTGLAARPIANTNVFCVAYPDGFAFRVQKLTSLHPGAAESSQRIFGSGEKQRLFFLGNSWDDAVLSGIDEHGNLFGFLTSGDDSVWDRYEADLRASGVPLVSRADVSSPRTLPTNVIHPKRILQQVVAGVRDYGNRMGIPTVNGAVYFDENYVGNPLVFAGCVGILPRDKITKQVNRGDAIVVMGGRTGRDGIHGATFSSAEISSTASDEFSHAVQIGNAIAQKQLMDVLLQARDRGLYSAVTDCGAGGLSSAIGEMGADVGATVDLDRVPLKYAGLRYDEIWISEAQERMVLSVPPEHIDALLKLSVDENVESTVIGTFGTHADELVLNYHHTEVARMKMSLLHEGIPMPTRRALCGTGCQPVTDAKRPPEHGLVAHATKDALLAKLADPNVASKHWIIRQYDHEVQGGTVVKPLIGPLQIGPSDAAVIRPKATSKKGVVLAGGMVPSISDPYAMALASIDEAIRNAVCVGARLETLAILDNFCWPGVHDEVSMGTLVRACEACRDAALGYRVPFISGKDSLHNQFTDAQTGKVTRIPNTLLISAIGVIDDVSKCVTSEFKRAGNSIWRLVPFDATPVDEKGWKSLILKRRAVHEHVSDLIAKGVVRAAHDVSDGGTLVAVAEMAIGSGLGVDLADVGLEMPFDEMPASYILEIEADREHDVIGSGAMVSSQRIGTVVQRQAITLGPGESVTISDLTKAWRGTLDW